MSTAIAVKDREKQINDVLDAMNPKLRAEFERIQETLGRMATDSLKRLWELGQRVSAIDANPGVYGEDPVGRMALCIPDNPTGLKLAARFHTWYSDEQELNDLLRMRRKVSNRPLTWAHIAIILRLEGDVKNRKMLVKKTCEEDLSPDELTLEVNKVIGASGRKGVGGRKAKEPKTVDGVVGNIVKQSGHFTRNFNQFWGNIVDRVEKLPADKITPEFLKRLDESLNAVKQVQTDAEVMEKHLVTARKTAQKRADEQAKADAKAKAEADNEASKSKK